MTHQIIAIDGFASTGKSTLSKRLAAYLGYRYIDTGYMYRAISYYAMTNGLVKHNKVDEQMLISQMTSLQFEWKEDSRGVLHIAINGLIQGEELRTNEVSNLVSEIASITEVRSHLLTQQRNLAKVQSVVMDGRDIGTVVFPNANHKFFLNADAEIRAQRRFDEMQAKGIPASFEEVLKNVIERDKRDSERKTAPLKKADDAIEINTSNLNADEVFDILCGYVRE